MENPPPYDLTPISKFALCTTVNTPQRVHDGIMALSPCEPLPWACYGDKVYNTQV